MFAPAGSRVESQRDKPYAGTVRSMWSTPVLVSVSVPSNMTQTELARMHTSPAVISRLEETRPASAALICPTPAAPESKSSMAAEIHWQAIALRLILTVIAGGLLGAERSRTGHAAGLRTTLLVTLAASVSMIQMNLLMSTNGKPHDSYAVMDLMRLPLAFSPQWGSSEPAQLFARTNLFLASLRRQHCGLQRWWGCALEVDN